MPDLLIKNKLIFIAALPKSTSSLMWLIVSALQEESSRANPNRVSEELPGPFSPWGGTYLTVFDRWSSL
jgi:hypothetical protein